MEFLSQFVNVLPGAAAQGMLWGIMALGVFITFKILDQADLTVEGSFTLGGAVAAVLIKSDINPFLALAIAILCGMLAGLITGFLQTRFKIPAILAGILTMTALYSINIRIMEKPNIALGYTATTMITKVEKWLPFLGSRDWVVVLIGVLFLAIIIVFLYWYFGTESGSAIRATGNNEDMARALGISTDWSKMLALLISNGLVALSGAMIAQYQGYADVKMGTGSIVTGLASVIIGLVIGELVCGKRFSFIARMTSVALGAVLYRVIIAFVLQLGLSTDDLKLFTAIVVAFALAFPYLKTLIFKPKMKEGEKG